MTTQIFPSRVRSSAACVSLLLAGAFVSACEKDPQSDCHVMSNESAQDPANGFEVTHQSPEHCPVDVPSSGGRTVYYSAKVRVIEGRQTGALALSFYDANNSFIIGGDFAWNPDLSGSKLLSEPAGNYTAGRVPPRFGVSQRDLAANYVGLVNGQTAEGDVILTYNTAVLAIVSSDVYVDQPFTATVNTVGPEPTWPVTYEWQLDGASVGSDQTFETLFHDNVGHVLEAIVTDAAGRVERKRMDIWPSYPGGCDRTPCDSTGGR